VTVPLVSATDVVVTLDTSGSMFRALPEVSNWLATNFEPELRKEDGDARLIVVADLRLVERIMRRDLRPRWAPSSSGINIPWAIQSRDSFEVLLKSAAAKKELSWLAATRPGSALHIVIVTDDDPVPRTAWDFVGRLTTLAGGALGTADAPTFHLHALLGYRPHPAAPVLRPEDDLATSVCGQRAGVDYQIVAQETGGLRSSSCNRVSLDAFTTALTQELHAAGAGRCHATLPADMPPERLTSVRATSTSGARYELTRVLDPLACPGQPQAYELAGQNLLLCPDSCLALKRAGLASLELWRRCE